jgi:hypothetical protein
VAERLAASQEGLSPMQLYYYYYYVNVLILFFSPVNANLIFLGIIINVLPLYRLSYFVFRSSIIFVYSYVLVLTL